MFKTSQEAAEELANVCRIYEICGIGAKSTEKHPAERELMAVFNALNVRPEDQKLIYQALAPNKNAIDVCRTAMMHNLKP